MRFPRGRVQLLSRITLAFLMVHRDADSHFDDFTWGTATSLKKEGGQKREQDSNDLKITGFLACVFIQKEKG